MTEKEALFEQIKQAVLGEDEDLVKNLVNKALEAKLPAYEILMKGLHPGLVVAGERYEKMQFFLTDLMLVGEITTAVMDIIKPYLKSEEAKISGKVVIGTVEGDIHDIGKNIVIAMLCGAGFEVYDIGIDQPSKKFVEKTMEVNADIVGASAILGAVKFRVREIHEELSNARIRDKVGLVCGGWGFTEEVARSFGADAVGDDAIDGLKKIEELIKRLKEKRDR